VSSRTLTARRFVLDGLPLQVRSAGIGIYTDALVRTMAAAEPETEFVLLGLSKLALRALRAVPAGSRAAKPLPPNVRWIETNLYPLLTGYPVAGVPGLLPVAVATGAHHLYHATNYVLPARFGVPGVVTVHDLTLLRFPELGTAALRRHVRRSRDSVRRARLVIADSEATRDDLLALLDVPREKMRVVHLGCDPGFAVAPADEARRAVERRFGIRQPYVLHVGTIEPRKNLERLVRAFAKLRRGNGIRHHLILAGDSGWGAAEVLRTIRAEGMNDCVQRIEGAAETDLQDLYRAADLFVYPSLYEGFGLPPLEAMASGTPVVASNVASLPEVVGDAALLVDPLDVAGLTSAIARGLSDEALREKLRLAGPQRARLFTWERCARETLAVYEEALAGVGA
jgi:glycosyltransferase involved in cell wall biosynthesis